MTARQREEKARQEPARKALPGTGGSAFQQAGSQHPKSGPEAGGHVAGHAASSSQGAGAIQNTNFRRRTGSKLQGST